MAAAQVCLPGLAPPAVLSKPTRSRVYPLKARAFTIRARRGRPWKGWLPAGGHVQSKRGRRLACFWWPTITGRHGLDVSAASQLVTASELRAEGEIRQVRAALRRAYADLVSAQVRAAEIAAARDRLRGLAGILARRETAGEAAGYDRLRAEREAMELEADWAAAGADRARAQAELSGFFAASTSTTSLTAVVPQPSSRTALPGVEELVARAEADLPELAALRHEIESADFATRAAERRPVPEPEIVAGTKSSNLGGGDIGSVFSIHLTVPLFDHAKPEQALAQARRAQAEARTAAFEASLRTQVLASRDRFERRQTADNYRASTAASATQLERIAQVSYDAGERGILELLDAYRAGEFVKPC